MAQKPRTTEKFEKVDRLSVGLPPVPSTGRASQPDAARSSAPLPSADWADENVDTARTTELTAPIVVEPSHPDRALLTILAGLNAGQVFPITTSEVQIGRSRDADVRIEDVGISRQHARIVHAADGRYILEDLRSTNGLFVNGNRVDRVELGDGDRVQIGPTVVLRFAIIDAAEEELARQLYESSTRDSLTKTFNRKYLGERLTSEVAYALRHKTRLSVVLFDIDHFKHVNDSHGHMAGDVVLRVVAAQVQRMIRAEDVLARYGGEEFMVLVRGIEHENVAVFAERIRKAIERLAIPWEKATIRAAISLGVASLDECNEKRGEELVLLADERLYRAKSQGRNRTCS
jgi:two-component system cell cycle response regulator